MARRVVYLTHASSPDPAIWQGLLEADCDVVQTRDFEQTIEALHAVHNGCPPLLVAEVQSGALALLALLRTRSEALPTTLLFDREGVDIHAPIKALEFGVRAYLLAAQPEFERKMMSRLVVENQEISRAVNNGSSSTAAGDAKRDSPSSPPFGTAPSHVHVDVPFDWDGDSHVITANNKFIRLSPIEGRIFDVLVRHYGHTVASIELADHALGLTGTNASVAAHRLRPHIMRLRRKLAHCPELTVQVVNARGVGYMMM